MLSRRGFSRIIVVCHTVAPASLLILSEQEISLIGSIRKISSLSRAITAVILSASSAEAIVRSSILNNFVAKP
jgi:hypothetical protein